MAVDSPDADEFDRAGLRLSPEMHEAQAAMAAERDEEYDPEAFERRIAADRDDWPDPIDDVEAADGVDPDEIEQWKAADE